MDIQAYMLDLGRAARAASRQLARTDTAQKPRPCWRLPTRCNATVMHW